MQVKDLEAGAHPWTVPPSIARTRSFCDDDTMAVSMSLHYDGALRCSLIHGPSGTKIGTDAPKDNEGKGELFSPTDLVGAALLSCAVTTMGIKGPKVGAPLLSADGSVVKEMTSSPPRKIAKLTLEIVLSSSLNHDQRAKLEDIARTCPVALSLAPEVNVEMRFVYR
jgi:putative redox protein